MRDDTTFNDFLAWVKIKPATESYNFMDNFNCAYAQFLMETGRCVRPVVYGYTWSKMGGHVDQHHIDDRLTSNHGQQEAPLQAGTFGGILQVLKDNGHDV